MPDLDPETVRNLQRLRRDHRINRYDEPASPASGSLPNVVLRDDGH
jgi:hypothetical protein